MELVRQPVDIEAIRNDALLAGGVDPAALRFRVVEYCKRSGERVGVAVENAGFHDAVGKTMALIEKSGGSHFCLEPVGFLQ